MQLETDSSKFIPKSEKLEDLSKLLGISNLTQEDIDNAKEGWLHDPPNEEFINLLSAD